MSSTGIFHSDMIAAAESHLIKASEELAARMRALDIDKAPVSDYTKRYYRDYLRKLDYALASIVKLLATGTEQCKKQVEQIDLIDHGGGIGIISFLASIAGFRKVIYSDIFEPASKDAQTLASLLNLHISIVHAGDLRSLTTKLQKENTKADLLVSRNVIEHIYDLNEFMDDLGKIPANNKLSVAFSTTANMSNPLTVLYTERLQKKAEYKGLKGKWEKETDKGISFLEIRKKIIRDNFAQLKKEEIDLLATRTRGYKEEDIIRLTGKYTISGDLPDPVSGNNTCDPFTGNRTEHLLPTSVYEKIFRKHDFTFILRPGFYNTAYPSALLNLITPLANRVIRTNKKLGLKFAPFIIIAGTKVR